MSEDEAKTFGIKEDRERKRMIRTDPTAKANMLPPAEHAEWLRFHTITLPNNSDTEEGDKVGVVLPWNQASTIKA